MTGSIEARQVGRIVAEVGIHLKHILIVVLQRPFESCDVGSAKSELAGAFEDEQTVGKLIGNKTLHDGSGAVRTSVVNHKNVETLVKTEDSPDDFLDVLLLVVSGDYYYTVAFIHFLVIDSLLEKLGCNLFFAKVRLFVYVRKEKK